MKLTEKELKIIIMGELFLIVFLIIMIGVLQYPALDYKFASERIQTVMSASDICIENNKTVYVKKLNQSHLLAGCVSTIIHKEGDWSIIRNINI